MAKKVDLKTALDNSGKTAPDEKAKPAKIAGVPQSIAERQNRKAVTIYLDRDTAKALKLLSVEEDTTIQRIATEAIKQVLENRQVIES